MIPDDHFAVEPWAVTERELSLDVLGQSESVFALSNGHIGLRGNLDEGEPYGTPGTYLNAFYEKRPLPYAERGYGDPEDGQSLVNVTNGKLFRLLVDDEPFDVRYGELLRHERTLDLRAGVLRRVVEWRTPTGREVRITSTRLVSLSHRSVAAIDYVVEPMDGPTRIVVQSELVANESVPFREDDPRAAAALRHPLVSEAHACQDLRGNLVHSTRKSGLRMAAGMDHLVTGPEGTVIARESEPDLARVTVTTELGSGQSLRLSKFLAYGWSSRRSRPSLRDQVDAALASAKRTGWDGLLAAQRRYLDDFWTRADVQIDGDAALQQAVRFALFHCLQAGARAERRAIPAKGLTGTGYDGHTFWDTEIFLLPVLTYTSPQSASDALRWRHSVLPLARERARELGRDGAAFPWRTIRGQECSGYWPAGTAGFHINADIAEAVRRYLKVTNDEGFEREVAVDLLVETARLWRALGHHDSSGAFRIDGVTGPDEYSALSNNNVYTNLMAARNLRLAAEVSVRHPDVAGQLGVDEEEMASWRDAASAMIVPYDEDLRVHAQAEGFTRHRHWDFAHTPPEKYPLLLHYPYYELYRSQVVKQSDLALAMYLCGENWEDPEQKARDFSYYESITVRDSSLSANTQAVVAAEVGDVELAYEYLIETAMVDLRDLGHNTADGLHLASLAGSWIATVAGFGGLRDTGELLAFAPRLPDHLTRLEFRLAYQGRQLRVEVRHEGAVYHLLEGDPMTIRHHGDEVDLEKERPERCGLPKRPAIFPLRQPAGRAPRRRHPEV
jgi:alpha,alpha-trehalose phosphorylase